MIINRLSSIHFIISTSSLFFGMGTLPPGTPPGIVNFIQLITHLIKKLIWVCWRHTNPNIDLFEDYTSYEISSYRQRSIHGKIILDVGLRGPGFDREIDRGPRYSIYDSVYGGT